MTKYSTHRNAEFLLWCVLFLISITTCYGKTKIDKQEQKAAEYIAELEKPYSLGCNRASTAIWNFMTNITKETEEASTKENIAFQHFSAQIQKDILTKFPNWREYKDDTLRREFRHYSTSGPGNMTEAEVSEMTKLRAEMEAAFATAKVCEYGNPSNCTIRMDPEIEHIIKYEKDPKILAYYWTAWYDKLSELVPPTTYAKFLTYQSKMAKANGFNNMFEMWMDNYEDDTPEYTADGFRKQMFDKWEEIRPMYEKLHAYVRMKFKKRPEYKDLIGECGYIPSYLLGNIYAQLWPSLDAATKPFPNAPSLDATEALIKKNYTVLKMFQVAEKFFTDLGLPPMSSTFWNKSIIERPDDGRQLVCQASAHDMCLGRDSEDFRIKQCGKVNFFQLYVIHHEMGHIAYFQQYTNQDAIFRTGANPGFHEAIGDALALAVVTPHHLQCELELDLGLDASICDNSTASSSKGKKTVTETDINFLYLSALNKLPVYPYTISLDAWRWEAFEGKLTPDQYNKRFWEIMTKNQGIKPPTDRNSPNLFDPATKYHIPADVEYLRYFISFILQFQFYEAMCIASGQFNPNDPNTKPLFQCDFSGSKEAGQLLLNMMKLGSSKGWPTALEALTGTREITVAPMKHYFQPLLDHLDKELKKNGEVPGFGGPNC